MHYFIGNLGHVFILTSFITSLVAVFCYLKAQSETDPIKKNDWLLNARTSFYVHCFSIFGIAFSLFYIINNHYFEYHYAYSHSSLHLEVQYVISSFWNGQEGSFLLWMFWQSIIGIILIQTQKKWEAPVMVVFGFVQAFLASMILGIVVPGLDLKIGSSPFILLRDAMDAPIFKTQPEFIPKDGNGLNPLLQNYWMVIHPPTLFLGFALTLVPFSFCIAGLWLKKYSDWVKPALPWTLLGGAILGLGILMGGYWAYETLNFGGYWNWDPVENAVYVPWLIMIASIHTMITYKNSETALKISIILVISVFILILYSTFLTRSGILGDSSVHSFTDLGLSGQLLVYFLFFTLLSILLVIVRWKQIPSSDKEVSLYAREFWIFLGATTLCLMGFQVLIPTSYPVINKVAGLIGIHSTLAPPGNQIEAYSKFQLWFGVAVALISGTGQFFWWKKLNTEGLKKQLLPPILISLILFALIIAIGKVYKPSYMCLVLASTYLIVSNGFVLKSLIKLNPKLSGGAIAHIGIGLILLGVLASAGYSKVVSLNNTGLLYSKEAGTEFNRDNLLLFINETRTMAGYDIEYLGERIEPTKRGGFIKKNDVGLTGDPFKVVAKKEITYKGNKLFNTNDTIEINPENTYYEIELRKNGKVEASLFPRIQINESMGGRVASPDIKRNLFNDLYTHVAAPMDPEAEADWGKTEDIKVTYGKEFFVNDYVAQLEEVKRLEQIDGIQLAKEDVAVQARIKIQGEHDVYYAEPIFIIKDRSQVGRIPFEVTDLGIKITLLNIHPESNEFSFAVNQRQKNWVIIKTLEKPFINILWIGTGVLMVGFFLAMVRRFNEFRTNQK